MTNLVQPREVDETLRKYAATDNQWKVYVAVCKHGSQSKAAKELGVDRTRVGQIIRTMMKRATQQGYAPPDLIHEVPEGLTSRGPSILYNARGEVEQYWNKMKVQGRELDDPSVVKLPDPKIIDRVSTNYDASGRVAQQWVRESMDKAEQARLWTEFANELGRSIPKAVAVRPPKLQLKDLLVTYNVGDHHIGMMAWAMENRADDYDLKISKALLATASSYLIDQAPGCDFCLLNFLGDFFHYDSFQAVTPTNRHLLDADSRYPKMLQVGTRLIRWIIDRALRRHKQVHVVFEKGNHDESTASAIAIFLDMLYENEPRVTVDISPSRYHYYEWGRNLFGITHGDGTKIQNLPGIMAAHMPEAWGRALHRAWFTGHIHHRLVAQDHPGCEVEALRVLAPPDAWAAHHGYFNIRDMRSIIYHREYGKQTENIAGILMLREMMKEVAP